MLSLASWPRAASHFSNVSKLPRPVADIYSSGADSQRNLCSMPVNMQMLINEITSTMRRCLRGKADNAARDSSITWECLGVALAHSWPLKHI